MGVDFGDAQSGVISYTTRAGGQSYKASASYDTDEPFGNSISNGLNRIEASFGGPIPGVANLSFFASGVVQGQASCGYFGSGQRQTLGCGSTGLGQDTIPTFVPGGLDTTVFVTKADGSVQSVAIPKFVQFGGQCDAGKNFGFECQGQRLPLNWNTITQLQGKLAYSYGSGSNISLTGLSAGNTRRNYPGDLVANAGNSAANNIGDPALYTGTHVWSRACPDRLKSVNVPQAKYRPAPPCPPPTVPALLPANAQAQESDLLGSVPAFAPDPASRRQRRHRQRLRGHLGERRACLGPERPRRGSSPLRPAGEPAVPPESLRPFVI